ncbi:MAG: lipoyl domain-containing protein, partial [Hydrogenophaga sp.]|uniref:lipoyl domain-containing protein n=1 Tax=Hydrogenophaga sp. TaxID=1904254 RepID=UPI00260BCE0D
MRRELLVPKLGLTMAEGTLVEWMVKPGDAFRADQSIFVIESEKAATEIPAEADGTLLEITAELGATLAVGTVIGFWDDGAAGAGATAGAPSPPTSAQPPAPA